MGITVETDDRGRITIPKEVREQFGTEYRLVRLRSGLKLIPIPDDPVRSLRESAGERLQGASIVELKETALERGREGAGEHITDE